MNIQIINGPNLNLLSVRERSIYGGVDFEVFLTDLRKLYPAIHIDYFQSNVEGELIDKLQEVGFTYTGVLLNAGAYTHTSIAIADAISSINTPVVEIHISNVHKREAFRHTSLISSACKGIITGFGLNSYRLGIESIITS
ncbi:type II 3-dehydroquinate dehydratase [Mucilaginibacter sp. cycad4]|uniref:type II 3-dehydroquinate dehydratase n=1 Tax=Mucilaginibacter sp. cycad4 TaxID=3342096 RepID=UPI002AABE070|nr:type II 3-dehydroquinate dehydratase [Mucilaginibacter gossypii]WPV02120.1 type II 3-dehydroquinate dehydratase [Mucilaginibacter gossypii]